MGILTLDCVTADAEATTFYGYAAASTYLDPALRNSDFGEHHVIVKSNTSPASPTQITWSLIAMINALNLTSMDTGFNKYSCAVSPQGVFTLLGQIDNQYAQRASDPPLGIQYDPTGSMDARFNYHGPGGWRNLTIDQGYKWNAPFDNQALGYVSDGATSTLVHSMIKEGNIYLASLNEATKTLSFAGNWTLDFSTYGTIDQIAIGNNHLYVFGTVAFPIPRTPPTTLTSFPLTGAISPTTPVGKSYNMSQANNGTPIYNEPHCLAPYLYYTHTMNALTLICGTYVSATQTNKFYTIKDPDTATGLGPPTTFANDITDMDYFVPLGDGTSSTTSFALMRKLGEMYVFGNDNGSIYTHTLDKIKVSDPVGKNPNLSPTPTSVSPSRGGDDSSGTAAAVGGIVGALAILVLVIWCCKIKKRDSGSSHIAASKLPAAYSQPNNNYIYPQQHSGQNDESNYYNPTGPYPTTTTTSYPSGQPTPTIILPMASITPVQLQYRTYQDEMQTLQFSSHPRPNVATTVGNDGESETSTSPSPSVPYPGWSGAPQAAWEPTPFLPPAPSPASSSSSGTELPAPSSATTFPGIAVTRQSVRDPQGGVDTLALMAPSPRPLIPHFITPSPEIGSPHTPMPVQNHPHT